MNPRIEIIISPTGETRLETKGFTGASCRDASRALEQALGTTIREQLTADYHAVPTTTTLQHEQGA